MKDKNQTLKWRFDVSTFRLIGRELITDRVTALFELVKNCYDANACQVTVRFTNVGADKQNAVIEIIDDGCGMSFEDIRDKWMVIGTSSKRKNPNTAPCIAYACWKIQKKHPDANIVVTPSDALVINTSEYQRVLSKALSYTFDKNAIVTIGIKPSRPETGYGYIAAAEPTSVDEIYKVEAFKEKPNLETAEQYLAAGNYYWNAGIFVWNIDTISKAIRTFQPQLASIMDEMAPSFYTEQEKEVVGKLFPTCEKISIDYAVMEKSKEIYTLPAEFGWSDLGSWGSLRTLLPQDEAGNAKVGKDIRLYECKNCVVHAADEIKVVVQGMDGYIVAEKNGQLLVCSLKEEQRIKDFGK